MGVKSFTEIVILVGDDKEEVHLDGYPPAQYSISKKVDWTATKGRSLGLAIPQWNGGGRTLSLTLVYDSNERTGSDRDVRQQTRQLTKLAEPVKNDDNKTRPPECTILWGGAIAAEPYAGLPFTGVVESVSQRFTLFDFNGTPVRATVDISFRETRKPEKQVKEGNASKRNSPLPARTHVVRRGDSLWSIAHSKLGDAGRWRDVAHANRIADPHALEPGTVLLVPPAE
jgi:nucleoid-associated protein YgaU